MDTITDILARPDEAARQLSEMRAALEAVTARLAAVTSERNAFKLGLHELREQYRNSVSEEALADAQNDLAAARAEVVRLNKLVSDLIPFLSEYEYTIFYRELDAARRADALRGDTAPAQPAADDEATCRATCWRRDEGMHSPLCPIHGDNTAPAGGESRP